MMDYDWCECVMSVSGITNIPTAIALTHGHKVVTAHKDQ